MSQGRRTTKTTIAALILLLAAAQVRAEELALPEVHCIPVAQRADEQLGCCVVESYGKTWLFSIASERWSAEGGRKVARIGPLPFSHGGSYTATYMEATFMPGMKSHVHRHAGPEAWYVLEGEQCLETPGNTQVVRAGESGIVPQGPPMMLVGTGKGIRRALVLILHDSEQPSTIPATDWEPSGSCLKSG